MSIRTVIEVNHDYIHDLERNPEYIRDLLRHLRSGSQKAMDEIPGVRFVAQRHHSETIKVTVK